MYGFAHDERQSGLSCREHTHPATHDSHNDSDCVSPFSVYALAFKTRDDDLRMQNSFRIRYCIHISALVWVFGVRICVMGRFKMMPLAELMGTSFVGSCV